MAFLENKLWNMNDQQCYKIAIAYLRECDSFLARYSDEQISFDELIDGLTDLGTINEYASVDVTPEFQRHVLEAVLDIDDEELEAEYASELEDVDEENREAALKEMISEDFIIACATVALDHTDILRGLCKKVCESDDYRYLYKLSIENNMCSSLF